MKGISLHEPYASAVAWDLKRIETRGFQLHWRGDLAICAAVVTKFADRIWSPELGPYFQQAKITERKQLAFGCIVAVCRVSMCIPTVQLYGKISPQEQALGNYEPGRFGWILADLKRLKAPIPLRGQQGIFNIPKEAIERMEFI